MGGAVRASHTGASGEAAMGNDFTDDNFKKFMP